MRKLFYDTQQRHLMREFNQAQGLGAIPGWTRTVALGHNPSVDTTAAEDVWEGGGLYAFQTSAQPLEALSSSALDTNAAGTGARSVTISGLDGSYNPISETFVLNGTGVVQLTQRYLRVNSANIATAGSTGQNQGDITIRISGGGATQALIPALYGFTRSSIYTVRNGFTLFIKSFVLSVNRQSASSNATVATTIRSQSGVLRMPLELTVNNAAPYIHFADYGIVVAQRNDFLFRCNFVSANGVDVTAGFEAALIDNTLL